MTTATGLSEPAASRRRNHWVNQIARHAHQLPDRAAIRFEGRTITWLELHTRVEALAAAFARRGVGAGDRVAIMMSNRPEFLETVYAVNRLGAIAVPINFRLTADEVGFILDDSGARVVVVDAAAAGPAAAARGRGPHEIGFVATEPVDGAELFATLAAEPADLPLIDVPEDAPALIMYTSGTTGRPKGAVLSHQNLQSQALTMIRGWRLFDDDEVNLCASPLFHIGAIGGVAPLVLIGGTIVLLPSGSFSGAATLDVLESERVTNVFLVPTQWQAICADPSLASRDLSALKTTCWGAAPATSTLLARMAEAFPGVTNVAVFGQTEMSPVTCSLDGRDALRKIGSVGKPVSTVAVRVVDADLNDVAPGDVGEIVYWGPTMMAGYWHNAEATAEAFAGGWFHSGDLVRVDDDGFFYVVDRTKDMIITGGENVYCAEVEDALAAHPAIREVSVIGAPHERWGETPVAVVTLSGGGELTLAELREWAGARLARYKIPTVLHVVDVLPRNATGKVTKAELRQQFAPS